MLFTKEFLFLHLPKTGGMSITDFILKNYSGVVNLYVPDGHLNKEYLKLSNVTIQVMPGKRHENLPEAVEKLKEMGLKLSDFQEIFTVIRNPYDLEVSRYGYLQKGHPWDKGIAQTLAMQGDFDKFAQNAPLWFNVKDYLELDNVKIDNLKVLRFENLNQDIEKVLLKYMEIKYPLQKINESKHQEWQKYINTVNEIFIYKKYSYLFDNKYYQRWAEDN